MSDFIYMKKISDNVIEAMTYAAVNKNLIVAIEPVFATKNADGELFRVIIPKTFEEAEQSLHQYTLTSVDGKQYALSKDDCEKCFNISKIDFI